MINPAQPQLLELAAAVRGPEWRDQLEGALAAAANAGWPWPKAGDYACRLMFREDADPRDLREAARDPLKPGPAGSPPPEVIAGLRARLAGRGTQGGGDAT